jgi:bacterial/archaeal transporter family-2 protein
MRQVVLFLFFPLVALLAGSCTVVQNTLNANLRSGLASWPWAALTSYLGGTLMMVITILVLGCARPTAAAVTSIPWYAWTGGIFGGTYIALAIVLLPRLGATTAVAFIVLGQMLTSLAFDQYGLMGLARQPATPLRIAGVLVLVLGVVVIRL